MLHQKLAELLPLGDLEEDRLIQLMCGKINRADQARRRGGDAQIVARAAPSAFAPAAIHREQVKLPRLPAVDHAQTLFLDLLLVEVDRPRHSDVLLNPRVFDRLGVDAEESLGQISERPVRHFLNEEDVLHLALRQNTLLHEQLTDLNPCWHFSPLLAGTTAPSTAGIGVCHRRLGRNYRSSAAAGMIRSI
jgi:hypothetical protein